MNKEKRRRIIIGMGIACVGIGIIHAFIRKKNECFDIDNLLAKYHENLDKKYSKSNFYVIDRRDTNPSLPFAIQIRYINPDNSDEMVMAEYAANNMDQLEEAANALLNKVKEVKEIIKNENQS